MICTTLWLVWFGRCQRIFSDLAIPPSSLFKMISKLSMGQYVLPKGDQLNIIQENALEEFRNSTSIIRVDGSFQDENTLADIGWTLNNNRLNLLAYGAAPVRTQSVIHTEILSVKAGLQEAILRKLSHIIIFTDTWTIY